MGEHDLDAFPSKTRPSDVHRVITADIVDVKFVGDSDLLLIADAAGPDGLRLRAAKRQQQHAGEDCNDRNDHEQLEQRKGPASSTIGRDSVSVLW